MKRLMAEEEFVCHMFTTGIYREICTEDDSGWDLKTPIYSSFPYLKELNEAIEKDGAEINFVDYMDYGKNKEVAKKLISIQISLYDAELMTTVIAKEELTEDDKQVIMDYMKGQFSDGWGESFEQRPICSYDGYHEVEYEDYNEENGESEYFVEEESCVYEIYVSWYGKNCYSEWAE